MSQCSGYDVKWSCENVPPPASYSTQSDSYIRWLPNWRTNSNVLRSGSANMTNNQLHNLSCDMSYHLLDVCLHLEKWKGDCGVHQQGSGRDTRRCRALNSGESSFLYIKHSKSNFSNIFSSLWLLLLFKSQVWDEWEINPTFSFNHPTKNSIKVKLWLRDKGSLQ